MANFVFKADICHVFHHYEKVTVKVKADTYEEAKLQGMKDALRKSCRSQFDSEWYETDIDDFSLTHHEPNQGEEAIPIRCDKTREMRFEDEKNA